MNQFSKLSPREQYLIAIGGLVLGAFMLMQFFWLPMIEKGEKLSGEIADYRAIQIEALNHRQKSKKQTTNQPTGPIATRLLTSAEAALLEVSRMEPEGERIRLSFEDVPFPAFLTWLAKLKKNENISIVGLELTRRPQPGKVAASMILEPLR